MKQPLLTIGAVLGVLLMLPVQPAPRFSKLYVFGDSLSDAGNTYKASYDPVLGVGFPPPPYAQRFSNGPVWVEYLGQKLGLQPTLVSELPIEQTADQPSDQPSVNQPSQGINFAVGGATTGTENTLARTETLVDGFESIATLPGLEQQISKFTSQIPAGESADGQALYVIWAGGNDYLSAPDPASQNPTEQPLKNLTNALQALDRAGARHILILNLPDLGKLPLVQAEQPSDRAKALSQITATHNRRLNELDQSLSPQVELITVDANTLFAQATAPNNSFGFTATTAPCFDRSLGQVCDNPSDYVFWDDLHPTTAAHRQVSELAYSLLQSQTQTQRRRSASGVGLLILGVLAIGAAWQFNRQSAA